MDRNAIDIAYTEENNKIIENTDFIDRISDTIYKILECRSRIMTERAMACPSGAWATLHCGDLKGPYAIKVRIYKVLKDLVKIVGHKILWL